MLRPATPLSVLLLVSFILLLLSVLSTPIVKSIHLASYKNVNFGVFGYCAPSGCSGIRVGYTTDGLFGSSGDGDWNLPSSARHSLSPLLIVHPVAALCNLICLILALAAHFHSPSHSARYLLALLILLLPTLLVTLLAFLVDILIFVPHLEWGVWIVLASTILITASGVVTCAMRRTLVSRKARKRRIAENAEMSGENFYNRQAQESKLAATTFMMTETKAPSVNGSASAPNPPTFTEYDRQPQTNGGIRRTPSNNIVEPASALGSADQQPSRYYGAPTSRSSSRHRYDGQQDQINNPEPPVPTMAGGVPAMSRRSNEGRVEPEFYRDGGMPPPRGGGYGPRGRGGYPARGGYPPRGGYGPRGPPPQNYPGRGGYPADGRGGFNPRGRGGYGPSPISPVAAGAAGMAAMAAMDQPDRRFQPPPGYPPYRSEMPSESFPSDGGPMRKQAPPPLDTAVAMSADMRSPGSYQASPSNYRNSANEPYGPYGARAQSPARERTSPYGSRRQSPARGQRMPSPPPEMPAYPVTQAAELDPASGPGMLARKPVASPVASPVQEFVPARAGWGNPHNTVTAAQQDLNQIPSPQSYRPVEVAELPGSTSTVGADRSLVRRPTNSSANDGYYEDVAPRFAAEDQPAPPPLPAPEQYQPTAIPPQQYLHPGHPTSHHHPNPSSDSVGQDIHRNYSYEDLPGARSPAESETSHFTSVSQRGVNPNWRPGNGGEFGAFGPARRPNQMQRDVLLTGNPDFEIPGMGPPVRGAGRMRGGMSNMPPIRQRMPPSAMGNMTADGRYPAPVPTTADHGPPGSIREV